MEELNHFSHKHSLILSKYKHSSPPAFCYGCNDQIISNTYTYICINIHRSINASGSCASFFLHKTCADLPPNIQHHLHMEHMLTLQSRPNTLSSCYFCNNKGGWRWFVYQCTICPIDICLKCASLERELKHESHSHKLTLLPLKFVSMCGACGVKSVDEFSYLCKTCLFLIHKSCALAPTQLVCNVHDKDHPLVLAYFLPEEYRRFGQLCSLCGEVVIPSYWLYYCAGCRYFAHVKCALSAAESGDDSNENDDGDVDDSNLVHFPRSEDEPFLLYQLIEQFARSFSSSRKAVTISHCRNDHSIILFDDKKGVSTKTIDRMICDGCVQPLLPESNSFYGCLDCNFFLHKVCATELPNEFHHASHPEHVLVRCDETSKPLDFFYCNFCNCKCNGMFYRCDPCGFRVDIVCAAMPSMIKHMSHKHVLHQIYHTYKDCNACNSRSYGSFYGCETCDYNIDIRCARIPGTVKHRWDEHQLCLMYPPVKDHPHDFNCELCSLDINPNSWFYFCRDCDTSFHKDCLDQDEYSNIKLGVVVKDDDLHQHSLEITVTRKKFECGRCGDDHMYEKYIVLMNMTPPRGVRVPLNRYDDDIIIRRWPNLKCGSCKFILCSYCTPSIMQ